MDRRPYRGADDLAQMQDLASRRAATLGRGKNDAEDNLRLSTFNANAAEDEPSFVPVDE